MTAGSGLFSTARGVKPHLVSGKTGVAGEVDDLRKDLSAALAPLANIVVEEFVNPIVGGAATLRIATATVTAAVTLAPAALTAATLTNMELAPRQLVFTTAGTTAAHAPATVTIKGTDARNKVLEETLALAQTATTATSVNFFKTITSLEFPPGDGTGATVAIGTGAKIGLSQVPKVRSAATVIIKELEDGVAAAVAGTLEAPGVAIGPYGAYTPDSTLDGALDFVLFYEATGA